MNRISSATKSLLRQKTVNLASIWLSWVLVATARADNSDLIQQFVARHCIECHDGQSKEGGLDLTSLSRDMSDATIFRQWVAIHDRVQSGEMPPQSASIVEAENRRKFVDSLAAGLRRIDIDRQSTEGRVQLRRLNRVEYENTLRDLFELPHLEVKEILPPDAEAHGFDNIGEALTVSYVQLNRYLEAADVALNEAFLLTSPPASERVRIAAIDDYGLSNALGNKKGAKIRGMKIGTALGLLRQANAGQHPWMWTEWKPPADGTYRMRTKSFGFQWDRGKALPAEQTHVISYYARLGSNRRLLASFDVQPDEPNASVAEEEVYLRRGEIVEVYLASLDSRIPKSLDEHVGPGIAIDWLEVEGPLTTDRAEHPIFAKMPIVEWTAESGLLAPPAPIEIQKSGKRAVAIANEDAPRFMVISKEPVQDAKRILEGFIERAFRRPVAANELDRYLALVREQLDAKRCFQEALRTGFKGVLCSPDFLFLQESPGTLDDYAIASRLSYFLWSSLPDATLLELAARTKLSEPIVLAEQVNRMLDDPKAKRFHESFCGQWLRLRDVRATEPDDQLYPEFNEVLLDSMVAETHAYFAEMLKLDLGVSHVVASDFAIVNGPLARLYGMDGVEGLKMRRVALPTDSNRGGFMTQAAILKVSANGTTTSPVTRGAWFLNYLLGKPPTPPPANVPAIEPDIRGTISIREQLEAHRSIESCTACHAKIDAPGFALENFDVIGGWRDRYRSLENGDKVSTMLLGKPVNYRLGQPVDASGTWSLDQTAPTSFRDVREFREILLKDQQQLARNMAEKILTYASGAGIQYADRDDIDSILDRAKKKNYGIRTLIHAVVQSRPFLQK